MTTNNAYLYTPEGDVFTGGPRLPLGMEGHCAARLNDVNKAVVAGGSTDYLALLPTDRYDGMILVSE